MLWGNIKREEGLENETSVLKENELEFKVRNKKRQKYENDRKNEINIKIQNEEIPIDENWKERRILNK